jgi:endonuclease/exonuclease/phosphatase family metal-dependent hydrolase
VKVKSAEVRTDFQEGDVKTASDHLPVVVEVEIHRE